MRDLLTGLAILLLVCLTGALVAPHLIDWDSRRGEISQHLSTLLGQDVHVDGPIGIELLPTPTLKLTRLRLAEGGPVQGQIGRFKMILALPPLLRGDIRVTQAWLQNADLVLRPGFGERPAASATALQALSLQQVRISDSRLRLLAKGGEESLEATGINGEIEAGSLLGPFRGALSFDAKGERRSLRFSTGRVEANALRLKALLEHQAIAARTDYDGVLRSENGVIAGEGLLSASGNAPIALGGSNGQVIWRMAAKVKGMGTTATLDQLEVALGNADRQVIFTGNSDIDLTRVPVIRSTVSVRQFDLDKLLAEDNRSLTTSPQAMLNSFGEMAGEAARVATAHPVWLSSDLEVSVGSLLLGGGVVIGPRLVLALRSDGIRIEHLSGEFPGRTNLRLENPVAVGEAAQIDPALKGRLSLESRDMAKLNAWFKSVPQRPVAIRTLRLEGDLAQNANAISIANATLAADDMRLAGSIVYSTETPRPKLTLRLNADQLDLAKLPDVPTDGKASDWDLDLAVEARGVRHGGVGAGNILLRLRRYGETTHIDDLTISDLGGANLAAKGSIGGPEPRLQIRLQASRLESLLQLADRVSAHEITPLLVTRAAHLAPADLTIAITPDAAQPGSRRMDVNGKANGTSINGSLRLNPAGGLAGAESLALSIKAPASDIILRQLGLETIAVASAGPADLRLTGGSVVPGASEVPWLLQGKLGGLAIMADARQTANPAEPVNGRLRLQSEDLSPLAQTLLIAVPAVPPGQNFAFESDFDMRGYRITLRDLSMASGDTRVKGEITFNLAEFGRVSGQLRMNRLNAASFMPLIFGEPKAADGKPWNAAPFTPPAGITLPGDLWIEADTLELFDGLEIMQPKFVLRFESGLIYLEHARGEWSRGALQAQATLRRNNQSVSLTARLELDNAQLEHLPVLSNPANVRGSASGLVSINAVGESPAGLISAIVGNGHIYAGNVELSGVNAGALQAVLNRATGVETDLDAVTPQALASAFQKQLTGSIQIPSSTLPLAIGSGVLRIGPSRISAPQEEIALGISLNMREMSFNRQTTWTARSLPKGWTGPSPSAALTWRGPLANPVQDIDVANLANGLTALAILRQSERIDALEQDQRERSQFNRRLRASEQQRRTEEEDQRRREAERRAALELKQRQDLEKRDLEKRDLEKQQVLRERVERAIREAPAQALPPAQTLSPPLSLTPPAAR